MISVNVWSELEFVLLGNKVLVRCLKLVKPYSKKDIPDVIDDDDDEDNMPGGSKLSTEGRVLERDIISQAYHLGAFDPFFLSFRDHSKS